MKQTHSDMMGCAEKGHGGDGRAGPGQGLHITQAVSWVMCTRPSGCLTLPGMETEAHRGAGKGSPGQDSLSLLQPQG